MIRDKSRNDVLMNFEQISGKLNNNNKNLTVMHINIRSLNKYFTQIHDLLINVKLSMLVLTEIAIKEEQKDLFNINGYIFLAKTRESRKGGGIGIYLKNNTKIDKIYNTNNASFESCCVEVQVEESTAIEIAAVYRPPNNSINQFLKEMEDYLDKRSEKK